MPVFAGGGRHRATGSNVIDTGLSAPVITFSDFPDGTDGSGYTSTATATGTTPITWSLTTGHTGIPTGLSFSSAGVLSGTPTVEGTYSFRITATNSVGSTSSGDITVDIDAPSAGEPSVPADSSVGTPANYMASWGGYPFRNGSFVNTWWARGWYGVGAGPGLSHHWGGSEVFVPGPPGAGGAWEDALEGPSGLYQQQRDAKPLYRQYLAYYFMDASQRPFVTPNYSDYPPFADAPGKDWWDDTHWADVCDKHAELSDTALYLGIRGLTWDTEPPGGAAMWEADGYAGDTHTEAQNKAKAEQRGYELGVAMWTINPACDIAWYSLYIAKGFNALIQEVYNDDPDMGEHDTDMCILEGLMRAAHELGATAIVTVNDASFYRNAGGVGPWSNTAAYQMNTGRGRAWMTQNWGDEARMGMIHNMRICGMTSRQTDGQGGFYDANQPSDAVWSQMLMDARNYSEGDMRWEYAWNADHGDYAPYETATSIAGSQAAASSTPKTGGPPDISNMHASASGGTVTITCDVAHFYGIYGVEVYDAGDDLLGAMVMTWNVNGGSISTNFNNAYQECEFETPGSSGDWFYVKAISIDDDVAYLTVLAT